MPTDRRRFLRNTSAFGVYALLAELSLAGLRAQGTPARRWASLQSELAQDLSRGAISQARWHERVNTLAKEVDLESLAHELRRARIKDAGAPFGHDPQKRFVTMLGDDGQPMRLGYGLALFDFGPASVITPHAHRHMASAHLVIEGRLRVRTFDRIRDEEGALLIRPTFDSIAEPGHATAMTFAKDNVHWFAPRSPRAMTLDVIIDGLDPDQVRYLIQPVDVAGGQRLADGSIRAPLVSFDRSMALYHAGM